MSTDLFLLYKTLSSAGSQVGNVINMARFTSRNREKQAVAEQAMELLVGDPTASGMLLSSLDESEQQITKFRAAFSEAVALKAAAVPKSGE
jgi:hypothetical protein